MMTCANFGLPASHDVGPAPANLAALQGRIPGARLELFERRPVAINPPAESEKAPQGLQ